MPKSHPKKNQHSGPVTETRLEELLSEQTSVILQAVDEKLSAQDKRIEEGFAAQDKEMEENTTAEFVQR